MVMQYFKDRTECFYIIILVSVSKEETTIYCMFAIGKLFFYLYNAKIRNRILFKIGGEIVLT